jgi:hypothetical protein
MEKCRCPADLLWLVARQLINEKTEIVFGRRSSHIFRSRSILHFEIAGNEQQDRRVQLFFRKSTGS